MKFLITGGSGQLGYDVLQELKRRNMDCRGVSSGDFDLADPQAVTAFVKNDSPDAVIHCAAYTAVDRAEDEPERCWAVNAEGTRALALACRTVGAKMLYISTDYVFPGTGERSYRPEDRTGPVNLYGRSKLAGEKFVRTNLARSFIVRTSWVFGMHGENFVRKMLERGKENRVLRVVGDQYGSPTYSADLAALICDMVQTEQYGTYHATNAGVCSRAQFAQEIFRLSQYDVEVRPVSSEQYPTRASRPLNSRICSDRLEAEGFRRLPPWQDALARYLESVKAVGRF